METKDWTAQEIADLRTQRGQSQREFGLELYDTTEGTAQKLVSDLERGVIRPGKAVMRTLTRMKNKEV